MKLCLPFYNDIWMDNALENFYSLLVDYDVDNNLDINLDKDKLLINYDDCVDFKKVLINIINDHKRFCSIKQKNENEIKNYKKDFIIIQHNRVGQDFILKPNLFQNPDDEVSNVLDLISGDSEVCMLCGNKFNKKNANLSKYPFSLKQHSYPFTTRIKSLNGIRTYKNGEFFSFKEYNDSTCPACYLIGMLGWITEKIIYRSMKKDNNFLLFLPKLNNLQELHKFKDDFSVLLNNNKRYSNISVSLHNSEVEYTSGKFSTLLCFYGKFLIAYEDIPNMEWGILTIPDGKVKNVKLSNFSFNENILNILKIFIDEYEEEIYSLFDSITISIDNKIDNDLSNRLKENISKSFLNNNFRLFSRNFIIKKNEKLIFSNKKIKFFEYFDLLIKLWRINPMGIDITDLETIKSVASIISNISSQNLSLFYKLDKTKNINEFWSCLREISKKLVSTDLDKTYIKESSLDSLIVLLKSNEDNWKEIRDLLIIYSSMYYSISKRD